jgi:hypothetical protein
MRLVGRIKVLENRFKVKIVYLNLVHNVAYYSFISFLFFRSKQKRILCLLEQAMHVLFIHLKRSQIFKQLSVVDELIVDLIVLANLIKFSLSHLKLK